MQLFEKYPILSNVYLESEMNYDTIKGIEFAKDNPLFPFGIVVAYMLLCYYGQLYMSTREPFDLRMPLAYWNLSLSLFSFIGMLRTAPHLIYNLHSMSLTDNLCTEPMLTYGTSASGLWVQLFIFSKIPELIDTFFIVARKKPLIFLHWYHHITVLLFCWHSYATEASTGLFFVVMNYSVHAMMYRYYYLMAIGSKPRWIKPLFITTCQILQMIIGSILCGISYILLLNNESGCAVKRENVIAGGLMYGSYLYLFCEFMIKRFFTKTIKKL
jgi:elongation of very long chain fatty acids protein 6